METLGLFLFYLNNKKHFQLKHGGADELSNNGGSGGMKRGVRRPSGTSKKNFYGKCDVRLTAKEDAMLSQLAVRNGVTRSDVMRKALKDYYLFNTDGGVEV